MLTRAEVLQKYQRYNPETGAFDSTRSPSEYARLLGVSGALLSYIYSGNRQPGMHTFTRLMQAFPEAAPQITAEMAAAMAHDGQQVPA